jgi:hypothetical protein
MNHFTVNTIPNLQRTRPSSPLLCCLAPAPIPLFPFLRAANRLVPEPPFLDLLLLALTLIWERDPRRQVDRRLIWRC